MLTVTEDGPPTTDHRRSPLRLGLLVSGRGTNLQAILDAIAAGELDAEVAVVVCNHSDAYAVQRAKDVGVPVVVYERKDYPSRLAQQQAITDKLAETNVELVVCAGWDRVFKPEIMQQLEGRIINIHPSLLPAFGGSLHAIEEALKYGVKITGCTIHFVTNELDSGPIILQAAVPVLSEDTVESLGERIHAEEHRLLVEAIRLYGEGRLRMSGRTVDVISYDAYVGH
jgi:phosphoribosylglycinamide formyltransferase-1